MKAPETGHKCYFGEEELNRLLREIGGKTNETVTNNPDIRFPTLPVDYSKIWTDHMATCGVNPRDKALEYGLYVEAFDAVLAGELALKNIGSPRELIGQMRRWINHEFAELHREGGFSCENVHHKAFYAYLHARAVERLTAGDFGDQTHFRQAGDTIREWVEDRLVANRLRDT